MIEFKTEAEAITAIKTITDKYYTDIQFYTKGEITGALIKSVTFIFAVKPDNKNEEMKNDLMRLQLQGYPITLEKWEPKFMDNGDVPYEYIYVNTEIKVYK